MKNWILLLALTISIISCGEEVEVIDVDTITDYQPFEEAKFWVYQVDSTIYDDNGATIINTSSFVRETIKEQLSEDEQFVTHLLERSWKRNETDDWTITDIWSVSLADNKYIKTEENLRFLKIATPILQETIWEGNQFDENIFCLIADDPIQKFKDWDYKILEIGLSENIAGQDYSDILVIQQADSENVIEKRFSREKYARGVGLVQRTMEIYDTQCNVCEEDTWEEKAEKGFSLDQVLIDHN